MFFALSKLLLFLTKPFVWILILFICGLVFNKWKHGRKLLIASFGMLLFFSNTIILSEFSRQWEIPGQKIETLEKYDCCVVLTGMASYNNDLARLELNVNGDRIWQAMDLYRRGKVKKILITGDSGQLTDRGLHEGRQLMEVIRRRGIPKEDLILEEKAQNTYENACQTAIILKKRKFKKILLLTNSTHMKRSLACFKKQGIDCTPFSVAMNTGPKRNYFIEQFFVPEANNLFKWENLTKEWIGYFTYKIMGYL